MAITDAHPALTDVDTQQRIPLSTIRVQPETDRPQVRITLKA